MEGRLSLHRLLELVPATMRAFPAGAVIAAQGAPAQDLVVVLSGRVRVERTHPDVIEPLLVRELGAGDVAGEAALLERDILSATLLAAEPTTLLAFDGATLRRLMKERPDLARNLAPLAAAGTRSIIP